MFVSHNTCHTQAGLTFKTFFSFLKFMQSIFCKKNSWSFKTAINVTNTPTINWISISNILQHIYVALIKN